MALVGWPGLGGLRKAKGPKKKKKKNFVTHLMTMPLAAAHDHIAQITCCLILNIFCREVTSQWQVSFRTYLVILKGNQRGLCDWSSELLIISNLIFFSALRC